MDYAKLGKSGLKVSRLCLGCMSYGVPERGGHSWSLTEEKSRPFIKHALEGGINFFDTANVYSDGTSEEIVGRALRDFAKREEIVLATKVRGRMRPGPNGEGLSRKSIMMEMDASLKRLGVDYVDLYQIHRWDYDTPIEETLEALHAVCFDAGPLQFAVSRRRARDDGLVPGGRDRSDSMESAGARTIDAAVGAEGEH
jgi:aryl-alcohol dehydrogenase-like predicted oxidoreductase